MSTRINRVPSWMADAMPALKRLNGSELFRLQQESLDRCRINPEGLWVFLLTLILVTFAISGRATFSPALLFLALIPILIGDIEGILLTRQSGLHPARFHLWNLLSIAGLGRADISHSATLPIEGLDGKLLYVAMVERWLRGIDRMMFGFGSGILILVVALSTTRYSLSLHGVLLLGVFSLLIYSSHRFFLVSNFLILDYKMIGLPKSLSAVGGLDFIRRPLALAAAAKAWRAFLVVTLLMSFGFGVIELHQWMVQRMQFIDIRWEGSRVAEHLAANSGSYAIGVLCLGPACILEVVTRFALRRISRTASARVLRGGVILDATRSGIDDPDAWRWSLWFHDPARDPSAPSPELQSGWNMKEAADRPLSNQRT